MNQRKIFMAISLLALLASCDVSAHPSSSISSSKTSVCEEELNYSLDPNLDEVREKQIGIFVYCWKTKCDSWNCVALKSTFDDTDKTYDLYSWLKRGQSEFALPPEKLCQEFQKGSWDPLEDFVVFEIPADLTKADFDSMKRCPYAYISNDQDLYNSLGLSKAYQFAKEVGYIAPTLQDDEHITRAYLKTNGAFFYDDYICINDNKNSHVFRFENETIKNHQAFPRRTFDAAAAENAIGSSFVELIQKYGIPSFVEKANSKNLDYICSQGKEICRLTMIDGRVDSFATMPFEDGFLIGDESKNLDEGDVSESLLLLSFEELVRKLGKPYGRSYSSPLSLLYHVNSGGDLKITTSHYGPWFDREHRGGFAIGITYNGDSHFYQRD